MLRTEFLARMQPALDRIVQLGDASTNKPLIEAVEGVLQCVGDLMNETHQELAEAKREIAGLRAMIERQQTGGKLQ